MVTDLNCDYENPDQCGINQNAQLGVQLGEYPTLRSLLNALKDKLQQEKQDRPDWESTKTLDKNVTLLETEYTGIATVIETYTTAYEGFKSKLKIYEDFYCKIVSLTNDPGTEELKQAIDKLREPYKVKKNNLDNAYQEAWKILNRLPYKSCLEQTKLKVSTQADDAKSGGAKKGDPLAAIIEAAKVKGAREKFLAFKEYQGRIDAWFKDLESLKTTMDALKDPANFAKRYAYRLEFDEVLCKLRNLDPLEQSKKTSSTQKKHNAVWLKDQLTETFRVWLDAVYVYFCWQKDFISKEKHLELAWLKYEEFLKNRREQFISEAEEIKPPETKY